MDMDSPQSNSVSNFGSVGPGAVTSGEQLNAVPKPVEPPAVAEDSIPVTAEIESSEKPPDEELVGEGEVGAFECKVLEGQQAAFVLDDGVAVETKSTSSESAKGQKRPAAQQLYLGFDIKELTRKVAEKKKAKAIAAGEIPADSVGDEGDIALPVNAEQLLEVAGDGEVAPSDGIEILVRLAQKGEINPKNVDIIDVTDKFLKLIAAAPKENLRQSGKILFHACVLLRMKAEALLNFSADESSGEDDFMDFEDGESIYDSNQMEIGRQITFKDLEKAIVRRSQRRQIRKRQVTLEELIEALREAERIEKSRADKKPARAVIELAGQHDVDGYDDLLDLAHDEDVETTIEKVEILLAKILKLGEKIELLRMVSLMDDHNDWVDAFLASLFLSNAGKIDLYQDEFYGPLYIALGGSSVSDTVVT